MTSEADIIPVDIGAAQAHQMIPWIQKFYRAAQETGIPLRWTAIGVIDGKDVASAQSVLQWGEALQDTVDYLVVHNNSTRGSETAWHDPMLRGSLDRFVKALNPTEIYLEKRRPDFQMLLRSRCATLGDVAERKTKEKDLLSPDMMIHARLCRKEIFDEFTKAHQVLLP